MTWIMIFAFYAGTASQSDSVSLNTATFKTYEACQNAGQAFKKEFTTLMKSAKYICISTDNGGTQK